MGDIVNNDKSMVVHNNLGPTSASFAYSKPQYLPQREQNHQGMMLWQSRLQEKLLKEQRDKKLLRVKINEDGRQSATKSMVHLPRIASSVSYNNLASLGRNVSKTGVEFQHPLINVPAITSNNTLTPAGPIPNQYFYGGGGAPRRSPSGRIITNLQGHIDIRYHQKDTRNFDQSIRYLEDKDKIHSYKQDLDKQIAENRRIREQDSYQERNFSVKVEPGDGDAGVELAPLLRTKVYSKSLPKLNAHALGSTDVTRPFVISPRRVQFYYTPTPDISGRSSGSGNSSSSNPARTPENPYASVLRQQTNMKYQQLQKEKDVETVATEKHFNTWDSFWGRPGHGAPINYYTEEQHKKGDLWKLLHYASNSKQKK